MARWYWRAPLERRRRKLQYEASTLKKKHNASLKKVAVGATEACSQALLPKA
jgi:hypothetical protein